MPIKVTCPKCQGVLHAPDDAGGKRGKCPTCGTVLAIPAESPRVASGGYEAPAEPARPAGFGAPRPPAEPTPEASPAGAGPRPGLGFGSSPVPAPKADEPRRPVAGPGRPLPAAPQPAGQAGPFAKTGRAPAGLDPEGAERLARAWKKARGGLFWVQLAGFLFLLSWVGIYGLMIAEHYGAKLPYKKPGYLSMEDLDSVMEIKYATCIIPASLGLICLVIGRFGFNRVPGMSMAKGMSLLAALSTFFALGGAIAFLVPTVGGILFGQKFTNIQTDMLHYTELNGQIQRFGFMVLVLFGLLGELYFHSALGRVAAHLGSERLSRRGVRRAFLYGFILTLATTWYVANLFMDQDINNLVKQHIQPQWDKLAEHKPVVQMGGAIFAGLVIWFLYLRLVGAARGAIREWLDQNDPAA